MTTNFFTLLSASCRAAAAAVVLAVCVSCSSYHTSIVNQPLADERMKQAILLLPPVSPDPNLDKYCQELGQCFHVELARYLQDARAVYGTNVKSLGSSLKWENIMINGVVNRLECAEIAKELKCPSVLTVTLTKVNHYPPFKAVLESEWIDAETATVIASSYNDVDLSDDKTKYVYGVYIGYGPMKMFQEEYLSYYKDNMQTAMLSPAQFKSFAAAFTIQLLLGKAEQGFWYRFWNVF